MALFDKFLKRKNRPHPEKREVRPSAPGEAKGTSKAKDYSSGIGVLSRPHVTEKAVRLSRLSQYVFKVHRGTNKREIGDAVTKRYGVSVERVHIIQIPAKTRRVGRTLGTVPGYAKAVVTLARGDSIDLT